MPTLHTPHPPAAHVGGGPDSWRFQRIVFALLRPPHQVSAAIADSARGTPGSLNPARGQAHTGPNHPSHWPTGCSLSHTERLIAWRIAAERMSWEH
jgi:hypothetical protein